MMGLIVRPAIDPFKTRRRAPKFTIDLADWDSDSDDYGRFLSLGLFAEGNNLSELIASAIHPLTDQDGGDRGFRVADSADVEAFITQWLLERQAEERK